eukprot:NODE_254_length_11700_cov_0.671580.p12 type:complete len:122 gc:universal NODE_254_length_11700_cov_0.671580:8767-8402(-)
MEDFFRLHSAPIGSLKEGQLPEILRPKFDSDSEFKDVLLMEFQGKNQGIPYSIDILTVCNEIHCFPSSFIVQPGTSTTCVFRSFKRFRIAQNHQNTENGIPVVIFKNNKLWSTKRILILEE